MREKLLLDDFLQVLAIADFFFVEGDLQLLELRPLVLHLEQQVTCRLDIYEGQQGISCPSDLRLHLLLHLLVLCTRVQRIEELLIL